jgi:hypothetical protein
MSQNLHSFAMFDENGYHRSVCTPTVLRLHLLYKYI